MALTQVSSGGIKDGSITNADLDSSAAIDGSKVSPDFGSQNIVTTGTITGASLIPGSNTVPANGIYLSGTNTVAVATDGTGRLFVDMQGRILIGTSTTRQNRLGNGVFQPPLQIEAEGSNTSSASISRFNDAAGGSLINLNKGRGTIASPVVVNNGDTLGQIAFSGYDGSTWSNSARIVSDVDGTPGVDNMPGNLRFFTTPSGSNVSEERLRITSAGLVGIGTSSPRGLLTSQPSAGVTVTYDDTSGDAFFISNQNITGGVDNFGGGITWGKPENVGAARVASIASVQTAGDTDQCGLAVFTKASASNAANLQESLRVTHDGKVGIGTQSPVFKLHVGGSGRSTIYSESTSSFAELKLNGTSTNYLTSDTTDLACWVNDSEAFRVDTSRRLLVGTSSTSSVAHAIVQGNTLFSSEGRLYLSRRNETIGTQDALGSLVFTGSAHNPAAAISSARDGGTWGTGSSHPSRLVFSTTADGASSPTERMRLTSQGQLLIGRSGSGHSAQLGLVYHLTTSLNKGYNLSTTPVDILTISSAGSGTFDITVSRTDASSPAGSSIHKLYIALRGSGANIIDGSLVQEDKATTGNIGSITFSMTVASNIATISVTGSKDTGEQQSLSFRCDHLGGYIS